MVKQRCHSVLGLGFRLEAVDKGSLEQGELASIERLTQRLEVLFLDCTCMNIL